MNRFWKFWYDAFVLYPDEQTRKSVPVTAPANLLPPIQRTVVFPPTEIVHEDKGHQFIYERATLASHGASFSQFTEIRDLIINTPRHDYGVCPCARCTRIRMLSARMAMILLDIAEASQVFLNKKQQAETILQDALAKVRQF